MKKKTEKNEPSQQEPKHHLKREHQDEDADKREGEHYEKDRDGRHEKEDHDKDDERRTRKPPKETRPHQYGYFIVSIDRINGDQERIDAFLRYLSAKGFKNTSHCPCSKDLQLWSGTTDLSPKDPNNPENGHPPSIQPTGIYTTFNFSVTDPCLESLKKADIEIEWISQPENSLNKITIAVVDSGVEVHDHRLNAPAVHDSYLTHNLKGETVCGTIVKEGEFGLNELNLPPYTIDPEPEDVDGHGTFICGAIAGMSLPAGKHIGPNENIRLELLNVKFVNHRSTGGYLFDAFCGIFYALKKGAKVINASWRTLANMNNPEETMVFNILMEEILKYDALLIAAAGNDSLDMDPPFASKALPAAFNNHSKYGSNVISVGAWDLKKNTIADFSNRGHLHVDLYAPGASLTSLGLENTIAQGQGTSYAAPYVARVAAILWGLYPKASAAEIKTHILKHCDHKKAKLHIAGEKPLLLLNHRQIIHSPL